MRWDAVAPVVWRLRRKRGASQGKGRLVSAGWRVKQPLPNRGQRGLCLLIPPETLALASATPARRPVRPRLHVG